LSKSKESYIEGLKKFMGITSTPHSLKEIGGKWAEKMRYYYAHEPEMIRKNIERRERLIKEYEKRIEKHRKAISRLKKRLQKLESKEEGQ